MIRSEHRNAGRANGVAFALTELPVTRTILAALLATAGVCGTAHAQSRPMPSYQDDETYGRPTPSDDTANSHDARADEDYPRNYGNPPVRQSNARQSAPTDDYGGYDTPPPPSSRAEDAAHRADRLRTAELNHRAATRPAPRSGNATYDRQSAQYRAELADHERAMQNYGDERARYAERIARWRERANACEAGDAGACQGPE